MSAKANEGKKIPTRKHNHFPMGKTGYDPKLSRLNHRERKK